MAVRLKTIGPDLLTSGFVEYYVCQPTNGEQTLRGTVKKLTFYNSDDEARYVTICMVPNGESPSSENTIENSYRVAAGRTFDCTTVRAQVFQPGHRLMAMCDSGSVVNIIGSVAETT